MDRVAYYSESPSEKESLAWVIRELMDGRLPARDQIFAAPSLQQIYCSHTTMARSHSFLLLIAEAMLAAQREEEKNCLAKLRGKPELYAFVSFPSLTRHSDAPVAGVGSIYCNKHHEALALLGYASGSVVQSSKCLLQRVASPPTSRLRQSNDHFLRAPRHLPCSYGFALCCSIRSPLTQRRSLTGVPRCFRND